MKKNKSTSKAYGYFDFACFCLYDLENLNRAIQLLNMSLKLDPFDIGAWYLKAEIFIKQEKFQKAINCYKKISEIDLEHSKAERRERYQLQTLRIKKIIATKEADNNTTFAFN